MGLGCTLALHAQQAVWSGAVHRGFLIPHRSNVLHLIQGHTLGGELNAEWLAKSNTKWSLIYGDPTVGFDGYFTTTGNPEALGSQWALHGFTRLPLGDTRVRQWMKLGLGVGYITQTWDLYENVRSPMVGSHLNAALVLQYSADIPLGGVALRAGLRLEHFSNGAYQLPNQGTNIASVSLGLGGRMGRHPRHTLSASDYPLVLQDRFDQHNYLELTSSLSAGIREVGDPLGKKYGVFVLTTTLARRWTYKSSFVGGIDVYYNRSMPKALDEPEAGLSKQLLAGAFLGYGMHFNAFELRLAMGAYLIDPFKGYGTFYHRFGLKYWWNPKFYAQFNLKTHFARADHGELGVGMCIGQRNKRHPKPHMP